jgi:ribosome biogenesis GTPase / thiamine phosphate phosphatase
MNLRDWGWDNERARAFAPQAEAGLVAGRVIRQDRGACETMTEAGARTAEASGRYRHAVESGEVDMPAVGDWTGLDPRPGCARAGIEAVLPRRSCLARQDAGRALRAQVLAANVDVVFLVGALDRGRGFSLPRLERALAMVRGSGAEAVVVLNKGDLCDDIGGFVREAQSAVGDAPVVAASARDGWGWRSCVRGWRTAGRASCWGRRASGSRRWSTRCWEKESSRRRRCGRPMRAGGTPRRGASCSGCRTAAW